MRALMCLAAGLVAGAALMAAAQPASTLMADAATRPSTREAACAHDGICSTPCMRMALTDLRLDELRVV